LSRFAEPVVADSMVAIILEYAQTTHLPPELIAGVMLHESNGDSIVEGSTFWINDSTHARAKGLMQIVWEFWEGVYPECGDNVFTIRTNLCYGAHILRFYMDRTNQNVDRALSAYSGEARAYVTRVLNHTARMYLQPDLTRNFDSGNDSLRVAADATAVVP
jgi:soluble lytic murein transglycosylase-like protein